MDRLLSLRHGLGSTRRCGNREGDANGPRARRGNRCRCGNRDGAANGPRARQGNR